MNPSALCRPMEVSLSPQLMRFRMLQVCPWTRVLVSITDLPSASTMHWRFRYFLAKSIRWNSTHSLRSRFENAEICRQLGRTSCTPPRQCRSGNNIFQIIQCYHGRKASFMFIGHVREHPKWEMRVPLSSLTNTHLKNKSLLHWMPFPRRIRVFILEQESAHSTFSFAELFSNRDPPIRPEWRPWSIGAIAVSAMR